MSQTRTPKISVIIPVYNCARFLPRCIESVTGQTLSDFELIIIEDHSHDNSLEICREYAAKDSRISVYINPAKGVSEARNYGLDKATGEYACFIDADDWVEPGCLADFFNYYPFPNENILVIHNIKCNFENGEKYYFTEDKIITKDFGHEIATLNILQNRGACCKLFSMKLLNEKNIRFPVGTSFYEDYIFFIKYFMYADCIILSAKYNYSYIRRLGEDTLSQQRMSSASAAKQSVMMLQGIDRCVVRFNIDDESYLKDIYFKYGLLQMMYALKYVKPGEYSEVARCFIASKPYFKYLAPQKRKKERRIRHLISMPESLLPVYFTRLTAKRLFQKSLGR